MSHTTYSVIGVRADGVRETIAQHVRLDELPRIQPRAGQVLWIKIEGNWPPDEQPRRNLPDVALN
jgi:hypothetical protein